MIKNFFINNKIPISVFFLLTIVLMWQMLLPGYLLTSDMVFTPKLRLVLNGFGLFNELPLRAILFTISLLIPGWVIQKVILLAMFFSIGFLSFKFIPLKNIYARYVAAIFYVVNPFVYERFLAGNWLQLLAYALVPLFFHLTLKLLSQPTAKQAIVLAFTHAVIGVFSVQFYAMMVVLATLCILTKIISGFFDKTKIMGSRHFQSLFIVVIASFVFSSYWIIPAMFNSDQTIIASITSEDIEAFKTSTPLQGGGAFFGVATMYGFWGENYPWSHYFLWPRDFPWVWFPAFISLLALMLIGFVSTAAKKPISAVFTAVMILLSLILAVGVAESPFQQLNYWLFDNFTLWRGFRDTQKWVALAVLGYAYFLGAGFQVLYENFSKFGRKFGLAFFYLVTILVIVYTFTMIGGFSRQLKPVWYPDSWHAANDFLNSDKSEFYAIFLPWHQYWSLPFNQNIITLNPAADFFDKKVIISQNIEIGKVYNTAIIDPRSAEIELILRQAPLKGTPWMFDELIKQDVKYIIDYNPEDGLNRGLEYDFNGLFEAVPVFTQEGLTIFEIVVR